MSWSQLIDLLEIQRGQLERGQFAEQAAGSAGIQSQLEAIAAAGVAPTQPEVLAVTDLLQSAELAVQRHVMRTGTLLRHSMQMSQPGRRPGRGQLFDGTG